MYSYQLSHYQERHDDVDKDRWSFMPMVTQRRPGFKNSFSSCSCESLLEQDICSADLMNDPAIAPHLSRDFNDSCFASDDYDQAPSFLAYKDRFISSSGGDSRTASLVEYGNEFYGDELCGDEFSDNSRRLSSATHNTRLLPDIPVREFSHGLTKSNIGAFRKASASSQRLGRTEPDLTRIKRSVTPTLLADLSFSVENSRGSMVSPTPSLTHSSPSFLSPSDRHSTAESMSSTLVDSSTPPTREGQTSFDQHPLAAYNTPKYDVYAQNYAYLYVNKPLPQPCQTAHELSPRPTTRTSASQKVATPTDHLAHASELIALGETYQKPRQAPPTLLTAPYRSEFDWSDDDGATHGLKQKLKSAATKSFTDLRQVGRQRSDSNRTAAKAEVIQKSTTKTSRQSTRYSSSSNASTIRASQAPYACSTTPKLPTSRPHEDTIQAVAASIKRTLSCRTPTKLRKQPSTKSKTSRKSASTITTSFAGLPIQDAPTPAQRPKLSAKRWNMTVTDNYTSGRPHKMESTEATASATPLAVKQAIKRKTMRQSANGKRSRKISLSRLRNWLRRFKLRR